MSRKVLAQWWKWLALFSMLAVLAAPAGLAPAHARPQERAATAEIETLVLDELAQKGTTDFMLVLKEKADLTPAARLPAKVEKGRFVFETLRAHAERTQAGLRSFLDARGASYRPYYIANKILVRGGDRALLDELAARPEIARILANHRFQLQEPFINPNPPKAAPAVIESNITFVKADDVWALGVTGVGTVMAGNDTGLDWDHPALIEQYRGWNGATADHNYNWWDATNTYPFVPNDGHGHGTHTSGTMVGDDGATHQIGMAPGADLIHCKNMDNFGSGVDAWFIECFEWDLAPWDLAGANPDPAMAPDAVNNSWGYFGGGVPTFQDEIAALQAAGVAVEVSAGNEGSGCGSLRSPGDYLVVITTGSVQHSGGVLPGTITGFSSRGPSDLHPGEYFPDIMAPGENINSSLPGGGYSGPTWSGTSMSGPHVTGLIGLMWSASPVLQGNVAETYAILHDTAVRLTGQNGSNCGGDYTNGPNNDWGYGTIDALAAVNEAILRGGPAGTLQGTVTDDVTGLPILGASVHVVGAADRTAYTDAAGAYSVLLPIGAYDATAGLYGYLSETVLGIVVNEDAVTMQDFALTPAPSHAVSGTVRDGDGNPVANATVTILNTPLAPANTDANGLYSFATVFEGTYDVQAEAGACNDSQTQSLVVDGDETLDFTLPQRTDLFGYTCEVVPFAYINGNRVLALTGDDASRRVALPFPITLYGQTYTEMWVVTNGFVTFQGPNTTYTNEAIPSVNAPNAAVYAFWDDLVVDASAAVRVRLVGSIPDRRLVVEWRNVYFYADSSKRVTFEMLLYETGQILMQYRGIAEDDMEKGNSATVGLENAAGTDAFQYSFGEAAISNGLAVLYSPP